MLETAFIFKLDKQASAFQQPASLAFLFCLCRQFVHLNAVYQPAWCVYSKSQLLKGNFEYTDSHELQFANLVVYLGNK